MERTREIYINNEPRKYHFTDNLDRARATVQANFAKTNELKNRAIIDKEAVANELKFAKHKIAFDLQSAGGARVSENRF